MLLYGLDLELLTSQEIGEIYGKSKQTINDFAKKNIVEIRKHLQNTKLMLDVEDVMNIEEVSTRDNIDNESKDKQTGNIIDNHKKYDQNQKR